MHLDYDLTLAEQVEGSTVAQTARMIGVTKDAVRQMLDNGRKIYLKQIGGEWHYSELKDWKRGKTLPARAKAA